MSPYQVSNRQYFTVAKKPKLQLSTHQAVSKAFFQTAPVFTHTESTPPERKILGAKSAPKHGKFAPFGHGMMPPWLPHCQGSPGRVIHAFTQ
jgi:hypothetical protein